MSIDIHINKLIEDHDKRFSSIASSDNDLEVIEKTKIAFSHLDTMFSELSKAKDKSRDLTVNTIKEILDSIEKHNKPRAMYLRKVLDL